MRTMGAPARAPVRRSVGPGGTPLMVRRSRSGRLEPPPTVRRFREAPRRSPCFETAPAGPGLPQHEADGRAGSVAVRRSVGSGGTPLVVRRPRSGRLEPPPMVRRFREAPRRSPCFETAPAGRGFLSMRTIGSARSKRSAQAELRSSSTKWPTVSLSAEAIFERSPAARERSVAEFSVVRDASVICFMRSSTERELWAACST